MPTGPSEAPAAHRGGHPVLAVLPRLGECLLRLQQLAAGCPPERLLADAVADFGATLPFERAWWGECSAPRGDAPPLNWQHGSLRLPASFAAEWNAIGATDAFALRSIDAPGTVVRASGYEDDSPAVAQFSRQHRLFHAMAVTLSWPDSGLLFFVALYRGEDQPAFDDLEAALFGEFGRHLQWHWSHCLRQAWRRGFAEDARDTALCEADGRLLYVGAQVAQLLASRHPGWQGTHLPPPLQQALARGARTVPLGRRRLHLQPLGDLRVLGLRGGDGPGALPPREREAALLYASGVSYKEIARRLALSPATVRTYLRDAYARLGVRTKLELLALLSPLR